MPTKSELQGRVTNSIRAFQRFMPPLSAQYPSVTVSTQRTARDDRALLVSRTGSTAQSRGMDEVMELIAGPKGSAILVYKERVPDLDLFVKYLWATLGEFYIFASTAPTSSANKEEEETSDSSMGAELWRVFAPEAIAYHVDNQFRASLPDYHPEKIEWREDKWRPVYDSICRELYRIYGKKGLDIRELAHFLAWLLADDMMKLFTTAVRDEKIKGAPDWIEKVPASMRGPFGRLIDTLAGQLEKEQFWLIDPSTLGQIDSSLGKMETAYQEMIADELFLDDLDALPIPKGQLPDDLWDELPEID